MNWQHGIRFFREAHPPGLNFARQSQVWMDVIQCCMMIGWTYLESSSFILFASNLVWLVTKIPEEIFSQLFLCSFHKGITVEGENSYYLPKVLVLGQKLILGKSLNRAKLVRWFPLQHQPLCTYLKIHANEIYNIYDKHMHLQPPFQSLYEQKVWGVECGRTS